MSIASELTTLANNKAAIKAAIEAKNPTIPPTDNLSQWPTSIGSIVELKGETKTVTPTTSQQTITPSSGKNGITQVTVNAVTSSIDNNIQASNIKSGVSILGVNGSVVELKGETKTITATTSQQTINPSSGKNGITQITVNPVTSSIDANIVAGNIKKDIAILGVTGTYNNQKVEQSKTVTPTAAGFTVTPDSGKVLSSVVINGDADLIAGNVKKDIQIFGVTGTYEGSGGGCGRNDVNFIDYDGTILKSYTSEQALALSEMPGLPSHSGLVAQGWNYTIQQMKSNVTSVGKCDIGCMYTTDDGKTRITLTIQDPKYSNIPLVFKQTVANGVEVDWGDGSSAQTYSGTTQRTITHQYSPSSYPQTYTVTFNVVNGTMSFPTSIMGKSGTQSVTNLIITWNRMIDSVRIGNNVTSIGDYAFYYCSSLGTITIPSSVTSIGQYVFYHCYSLSSITISSSVSSIGQYSFGNCYSLSSITIPSSVTSIGNMSVYCCDSLGSITIPNSVTSLENHAIYCCHSLGSITIPSSVTSIGSYAFATCHSLASVTIPSSVTSIENQVFNNCFGLKTFDFRTFTSVPSLANVNAFKNTPSDKEIIVPDELYDTWIGSTNWNSTTNQISTSIVKASQSSLGTL